MTMQRFPLDPALDPLSVYQQEETITLVALCHTEEQALAVAQLFSDPRYGSIWVDYDTHMQHWEVKQHIAHVKRKTLWPQ